MNVISWDRAYCLYPRSTLTWKTAYLINGDNDGRRYTLIKQKYTNRGFRIFLTLRRSVGVSHDHALTNIRRQVGDSLCWTLPLSTVGVVPPRPFDTISEPLTRDPCCFTWWRLKLVSEPNDPKYATLHTEFMVMKSSNVLYYDYVKLEEQQLIVRTNRTASNGAEGEKGL